MVNISNAYCGIEFFLGTTPVWGSVYSKKAIAFLIGAAAYVAVRTSFFMGLRQLWIACTLILGVPILSKESLSSRVACILTLPNLAIYEI